MNRILFLLLVSLVLIAGGSRAQEAVTPSFDPTNKVRCEQTAKSLVHALESESPGLQASAAQTIRELKGLMPRESFTRFVIPLMRIVKDDRVQVETRIMAALALHELQSDRGDFCIRREAAACDNARLGHILAALATQRVEELRMARDAGKEGTTLVIAGAR